MVLQQRLQSPQLDHYIQKNISEKPGGVEVRGWDALIQVSNWQSSLSLLHWQNPFGRLLTAVPTTCFLHSGLCFSHTECQINYLWNPLLTGEEREGEVRNNNFLNIL